jgi:hypothetical protein
MHYHPGYSNDPINKGWPTQVFNTSQPNPMAYKHNHNGFRNNLSESLLETSLNGSLNTSNIRKNFHNLSLKSQQILLGLDGKSDSSHNSTTIQEIEAVRSNDQKNTNKINDTAAHITPNSSSLHQHDTVKPASTSINTKTQSESSEQLTDVDMESNKGDTETKHGNADPIIVLSPPTVTSKNNRSAQSNNPNGNQNRNRSTNQPSVFDQQKIIQEAISAKTINGLSAMSNNIQREQSTSDKQSSVPPKQSMQPPAAQPQPQQSIPSTSSRQNNQGQKQDQKRSEKIGYKTLISLTSSVSELYRYDKYELAHELEKGANNACKPYRAYLKDDTIHYICWDKIQHTDLPNKLKQAKAFNDGILEIKDDTTDWKDKESSQSDNQKQLVFASIQRNLNERDFDYLKRKYGLEKKDIKHISQTTFTLNFQDKSIQDQVLKIGSIQLGPELIIVSLPKEKETRQAKVVLCFFCQSYGHFRSWCISEKPTCRYCSRKHESNECQWRNDARYYRCANCDPLSNKHKAGSKDCPKHQEEIRKAQNKQKPKSQNTIHEEDELI